MENLPQPLLRYRIHSGQVTQKVDEAKARKHFILKKTYYRELNIGLTDPMQEALCHAAYYGKVTDAEMAHQLKQGLFTIAKYYGCSSVPKEYAVLLSGILRAFPRKLRWKLGVGLPLKTRMSLLR